MSRSSILKRFVVKTYRDSNWSKRNKGNLQFWIRMWKVARRLKGKSPQREETGWGQNWTNKIKSKWMSNITTLRNSPLLVEWSWRKMRKDQTIKKSQSFSTSLLLETSPKGTDLKWRLSNKTISNSKLWKLKSLTTKTNDQTV